MESVFDWINDAIEILYPHVAILAMPIVLGVLVILILALLACKKWIWSIALLIVAAVANFMTETFAISFPRGDTKDGVTIITYNMLSSSEYMKEHGENPKELYEMLMQQSADVICLQEYDSVICFHLKESLSRSYPHFALMPKITQESAVFS